MTDAATAGLREAVLGDDQRHIGVPMLLHTPVSLAAEDPRRSAPPATSTRPPSAGGCWRPATWVGSRAAPRC